MDRVTERPGTNKNAIYRRWASRLALGIAANRQLAATVQLPDTGSLRGDVLELLRGANRHWVPRSARSCGELLSAAGGAPDPHLPRHRHPRLDQTLAPPMNARQKLDAGLSVDEFTHDIKVTVVAGNLFDEVEDHPAQVHVAAVADRTLGR
ncbi:hypothetical protein MBA17_00700 [Streptosporangium sp. KLBMP 9127]|nr:hypothetical protein [Streptosporangium sp. KLBMP 9127]